MYLVSFLFPDPFEDFYGVIFPFSFTMEGFQTFTVTTIKDGLVEGNETLSLMIISNEPVNTDPGLDLTITDNVGMLPLPCNNYIYLSIYRYPKQLCSQEWSKKPCRGRQRKTWGRVVDAILECLQEVEGGDSSAALFMASIEESVSERECKLHAEELRSKVKLSLYRTFSKKVRFKKCLRVMQEVDFYLSLGQGLMG